jgi:signal transduction histidine kinase/ligand-binding sensor domain-containing protein
MSSSLRARKPGPGAARISLALFVWLVLWPSAVPGVVLWSDLGQRLVRATGQGEDILNGAVKRDQTSTDILYFKFHVEPLSDFRTEEYFAAFQLYEGQNERLGVGNSLKAWAYSAFNTDEKGEKNEVAGDIDLHAALEDARVVGGSMPYELPRRGVGCTIVFKAEYVAGTNARVTVWLNPDLAPGATEMGQVEGLTTHFAANACFDEIHLRHGGGGDGWVFSDMEIATAFGDFVAVPLSVRVWQREQGLPQNSIHALAQTSDGYLWLGGDDGLTRFDGVRFASFGLREGMPAGQVRALLEDNSGALWIGTSSRGLVRWQEGDFTRLTEAEGLPADGITALAQDAQGQVWVGTEGGLALWSSGRLAHSAELSQFNGRNITTLFKDRQGVMWLGASGLGVFRFVGDRFVPLSDPTLGPALLEPHCLLEDHTGRIWLGAGDDLLLCRDAGQWRHYRMPRHRARAFISTLVEDQDGTVWAGSVSEGLFQFQDGKLLPLNTSSGLSDNAIGSLLVDSEGDVWVGTSAGLNRLRRKRLTALAQNEGLGYGAVQGLAELAPGIIWAGKPSGGLYGWHGRMFEPVGGTDFALRAPAINTVLKARDGSCWVAGGNGLWHFRNPLADAPAPDPAVLEGRNVLALAEDADGRLWAGTSEGELWVKKVTGWQSQTNFSPGVPITCLLPADGGLLWLGTRGAGLFQFGDHVQLHLDKKNGLLSDFIRALHFDAAGALWIGTAGGGLSLWRNGHLATFTMRDGLPDNTVSQILDDDSGRLWLGTDHGIARVAKHALEELAAGKTAVVYPEVYGRAEGMLSEECTGGYCPAGLITASGELWFSTMKGVLVAEPQPRGAGTPAPRIALEEIVVDGSPLPFQSGLENILPENQSRSNAVAVQPAARPWATDQTNNTPATLPSLTLAPGKHRLEFHYTGLSFTAPERVRFRYRLENLDSEWVEAETRRAAYYPYVPPGEYVFRVTACNSEGVWNPTGAAVRLMVRPQLWQTWWFVGLATLGLLGSVGGAARLVEKRKLHRRLQDLEQERTLERERARIAQDLHDDLGASLTRVSLLSDLLRADKENPSQVETHAVKISQSARQTVRALEEIVWALRPGSDSVQSLIEYIAHFANELFESDQARCRLDLQRDLPERSLPPDMRHNLFLIVKEALTNALKHAGATEVRVQARATADTLELQVQDNGRGFQFPTAPARPGKRQGLGNMRARAETLGATLDIKSELGKGTEVRLLVRFV